MALAKKSSHRVMSSPSFKHFTKPHMTHLHAVTEFGNDDEPLCSFIQRGSKFKFYRGWPDWSDWMKSKH